MEITTIAFCCVVVATITRHDYKFIISTSSFPFVKVTCGSTTIFAFKHHRQLLLMVGNGNNSNGCFGKITLQMEVGWSHSVKGAQGPGRKLVCVAWQVEGIFAGASFLGS